ncbi:unnamed protein product [Prorocentrum cordatum]|uniref:Uncharacterized protein n=1 Tax=Prorocentrum cordatum TaxID=2364126 RepID=A0ABN9SYF4_9DINO|nr:unnamed protein product [Polarella glacialis]
MSEEHPIRASQDKLVTDSRGVPTTVTTGGRKCPADIDDVLREKLRHLAVNSHKALGCRDYSLYDVRIDPQGEPYFLEARACTAPSPRRASSWACAPAEGRSSGRCSRRS